MRTVSESELATEFAALTAAQPRVVTSGNLATPRRLLEIFDANVESYRLFVLNAQSDLPRRPGVVYETPFVGPGMRGTSGLDYLPMRLSLVPRLFEFDRPPDVVLLHTSVPRDGRVSLGIEVNILPAAIERTIARGGLVVAQLNPAMPYVLGDGEIDCDRVALAVEVESPLASPSVRPFDDVTLAIGSHVTSFVGDGATLQLGIGQVPDAILHSLGGRRRLGIWSEMISDGVLALDEQGALDPDRPVVASFMFGSRRLYDWADANPRLRLLRTESTNDPGRIAANPAMTSLNTALQVDLFAQANASYVGDRIYSGFGGQTDFIVGALHSPGGHAVVALPSWHAKSDRSTIVPVLPGPVTSFQHTAIVTEQGCAHIFGRSQRAQARLMIEQAAHPDARPGLWKAAEELGLVR